MTDPGMSKGLLAGKLTRPEDRVYVSSDVALRRETNTGLWAW